MWQELDTVVSLNLLKKKKSNHLIFIILIQLKLNPMCVCNFLKRSFNKHQCYQIKSNWTNPFGSESSHVYGLEYSWNQPKSESEENQSE